MGLILDLAVLALAMVVIGSLAFLAWTLAVSAVQAVGRERAAVVEARRAVTEAEVRLVATAGRAASSVEGLVRRTGPERTQPDQLPGEQPDA